MKTTLKIICITDSDTQYFQLNELVNSVATFKSLIYWARSYEDAVKALDGEFDIALFDDNLKTGDTFQFLKHLKANKVNLPVIAISEGLQKDRDIRLLREGAADYLVKNALKPAFLYRAIRYALERFTQQTNTFVLHDEILREHKLNALGELASNIALELSQCIDNIEDRLNAFKPLTEKGSDLQSETQKDLKKAKKIIKNLLAFAPKEVKVTAGSDLVELIADSADFLNRATRQNIKVICLQDASQKILADINRQEIRQALANLVINAQEAMPNGGKVQIRVQISPHDQLPMRIAQTGKQYAAITVKDDGIGIPNDAIERLFEPTFTTKSSPNGLGLGLTRVFAVAKAHHGYISVDSKIGRGSTFTLYLPLSETHSATNQNTKGLAMVLETDPVQNEVCKLYFEAAALESRIFSNTADSLRWYRVNFNLVNVIMLNTSANLDLQDFIEKLKSINPQAKIFVAGDAKIADISQWSENGIKYLPEENKYLAAITLVGENKMN